MLLTTRQPRYCLLQLRCFGSALNRSLLRRGMQPEMVFEVFVQLHQLHVVGLVDLFQHSDLAVCDFLLVEPQAHVLGEEDKGGGVGLQRRDGI